MNTQLPLLPPPPAPTGVFAELGRYMVGEGPKPVELVAAQVAGAHRRRVAASWGGR